MIIVFDEVNEKEAQVTAGNVLNVIIEARLSDNYLIIDQVMVDRAG